MIKVLNVKQNNTSGEYAVYLIDTEIVNSVRSGLNVLIVIHGYGSSGKGGVIKSQVTEYLQTAFKNKKIKAFVPGEQWSDFNLTVKQMQVLFPQLILHSQVKNLNSGISVVWVQ